MFSLAATRGRWGKYLTWLLWSELLQVQNNSPCKGSSITELDEDILSSWENAEQKLSGFSSPICLSSSGWLVAKSWDFCACWLNFSYTEGEWLLSSVCWNRFKSTICCRIVCLSWSLYKTCHKKLKTKMHLEHVC